MNDNNILKHINALVEEEQKLRDAGTDGNAVSGQRLREGEEHLDQCWDLLRQRRALREFGRDAGAAKVRDAGTVEGYTG